MTCTIPCLHRQSGAMYAMTVEAPPKSAIRHIHRNSPVCDGCGSTFLQNPPETEALTENFAREKTHVRRAETRTQPPSTPYGIEQPSGLNARWCGFRGPDHINYFTLASLRDIARRLGFSITLVNRITLPVDDNVQVLLAKN